MLAAISALFLILCLCVMVTAARGRGGGIAGALLRRFADVPLLGRLVAPLLDWTPTPDAPVLELAVPSGAEPATPTPAPADNYLVRPTNWPTGWAWPPGPLTQPASAPQGQSTMALSVQPPAPPAPAPASTPTPSEEEQRKLLEQGSKGPSG